MRGDFCLKFMEITLSIIVIFASERQFLPYMNFLGGMNFSSALVWLVKILTKM